MKTVVLTGSPHKAGTYSLLAESFIEGVKEFGHEIDRFYGIDNMLRGAGKKTVYPQQAYLHGRKCPARKNGGIKHE